jgi:hypothetical protein
MTVASVTALPLVVLAGIIAISATDAWRVQFEQEVNGFNGLSNDIDRRISADPSGA